MKRPTSTADPRAPADAQQGLPAFSRQRLVQFFFFAVFLFLFWQVVRILAPFYVALLGSAILALLVYPLHERLARRMERHPSVAAGLTTAAVVLMFVIPVLILGWTSVKETAKVYPVARKWIHETEYFQHGPDLSKLPPRLLSIWESASGLLEDWDVDPKAILLTGLNQMSTNVTGLATGAIKNTLLLIFNLLVLAFTLFFFLRDGPFLIQRMVELVPMAPRNKEAVLNRLQTTLYAVIRGVLVIAILQGLLAGLGYAMFRVPFPALLGMLTCVLAVLPFIGPASIWVPVAVGLTISGAYQQAILVFVWGSLVLSVVDNFLRPLLISTDAKLPVLMMFFGIIGGLKVYGFAGLLMGPVIIALLLAFVDIYRREYHWLISPAHK
ncbi:MAG: AI-2E family transporter [Elusimicrobiota bacterium]